jgi:hypothetical protein
MGIQVVMTITGSGAQRAQAKHDVARLFSSFPASRLA